MWVGEIRIYWLNWKILILSCLSVVFLALLSPLALLSVSSFSHKLLFSPGFLTFPRSRYCTSTLCVCHYCAGFMCGLASFFLFYLWTFCKVRMSEEYGQYLSQRFAEHKVQLKNPKSQLLVARTQYSPSWRSDHQSYLHMHFWCVPAFLPKSSWDIRSEVLPVLQPVTHLA